MTEQTDHSPYVLAIDIGTSSVRAIAFDRRGEPVGEGAQVAYQMETTADGGVTMDAERLLRFVGAALDTFCKNESSQLPHIRGVAVSTFWHNVMGVDAEGRAVTPLISWADTRPAAVIGELRGRLDETAVHARTGCMLHPSYLPAKLLWLSLARPDLFERAVRWMSIGEYLALRFFGRQVCSLSMASGTGLFNPHTCAWDAGTIDALPVDEAQLSPLADLRAPLTGMTGEYAARWPALADAPWWPAVGDGACSNIGSGCVNGNRIALMVGTSGAMRVMWSASSFTIPKGLWCYRADGRRILMGGALSNGGNVYGWMRDTLQLGDRASIERALAEMAPDAHGLTVLPFWAGERSPGWHASARATITGMTLHTTPLDILRAGLESTAYCFASIYAILSSENTHAREIIASGAGLLQSPAWMGMMADVLGKPVTASDVAEASSRGAALLALEALGAIDDLSDAPAPLGDIYEPDIPRHEQYCEAMRRQEALYEMMMD